MPRLEDSERLKGIHADALIQFDDIQSALKEERQHCLEDRRFYSIAGAQWEGALGEQFENKPKFEVNKVHLAVIRIINEYRNNRISVKFISKDGAKREELADTCAGLFRSDEHDSVAEEAYDNSFEEAVGGGFGAMRLRAVYEDEEDPDNEQQCIRIEPIYDADTSVFFDLDAKRQDKSDAKYCFVIISMTRDKYKDLYDDDPSTWDKEIANSEFDWAPPDLVFVAEYYLVEDKGDTIITYKSTTGEEQKKNLSDIKRDPSIADTLEATGWREIKRRRFKARKIHKYIMSGDFVLEDSGYIAGKCIPIVPTYGKRWFIDNIERCMGHVRLVKDAQRLKNMQLSKLGEIASLSSMAKPIFTPEQVAGVVGDMNISDMWSRDNIENFPYLVTNPITSLDGNPMPAGPIAYTKPPEIPQALAALLTITDVDIKDLLGNQAEADKMVSNIAEKTLLSMHERLDMQTYIYVSNFAKAIKRVGEVWLSMARELYVEDGRKMKVMDATDTIKSVTLQAPTNDPQTGGLTYSSDLSAALLEVAVEVGPSSASRREATIKMLTEMLGATQGTQDPETAQVLMSMIMMNMEGEGVGDVRDYFRGKLVKMGVLKPNEEEAKAMAAAPQEPSANDKALHAMADQSEADATKKRSEVLKIMADVEQIKAEIELTKAKTLTTLAEAEQTSKELNTVPAATIPPPPKPEIPPITVHIHNDGQTTTKVHKIERGPDGEMVSAEITRGPKAVDNGA
jgi:hypothetical protein